MNDRGISWVLGHRIRPIETDKSYGMIEVTSPPGVAGPPPHYHRSESEFFFIMKGTLDVMRNGTWERVAAGSFVDLPPHTTHTFINKSDEDVVWITGWRPKGFQVFFEDFGVPEHEEGARDKSVAADLVQNVVRSVERYGMYLAG
jgi:quercetin dioxygenase-like cupin family protein